MNLCLQSGFMVAVYTGSTSSTLVIRVQMFAGNALGDQRVPRPQNLVYWLFSSHLMRFQSTKLEKRKSYFFDHGYCTMDGWMDLLTLYTWPLIEENGVCGMDKWIKMEIPAGCTDYWILNVMSSFVYVWAIGVFNHVWESSDRFVWVRGRINKSLNCD